MDSVGGNASQNQQVKFLFDNFVPSKIITSLLCLLNIFRLQENVFLFFHFYRPPPDEKKAPKFSKDLKLNVRRYVFSKYIEAVKNYDKVLEKRFPAAMNVYRVFVVGMKDFYADLMKLMKITRIIKKSENGMRALTRKELELYYQMPQDMRRIAPVILISILPFANYVIFPLAYNKAKLHIKIDSN